MPHSIQNTLRNVILILIVAAFSSQVVIAEDTTSTVGEAATALDMKSNGKLAVGRKNGNIEIYSPNMKLVATLHAPDAQEITALAWNPLPNDDRLAAISDFQTISVWDTVTKQQFIQLAENDWATDVMWNPAGSIVATVNGNGTGPAASSFIVTWDPVSGKRLKRIDSSGITSVTWYPRPANGMDSLVNGTAYDYDDEGTLNSIEIWNVGTSASYLTTPFMALQTQLESISDAAWNPAGTRLAGIGNNSIEVWNVPAYQSIGLFPIEWGPTDLAWSPDNISIAVTTLAGIFVLDTTNGHVIASTESFDWSFTRAVWNNDGSQIIFGMNKGDEGKIMTLPIAARDSS